MTPDKNKKPLPSSTSRVFPEHPKTTVQWKIALRRIKVLYLGGHWQQCSARCDQLLRDENATLNHLHATYIHFYSALSSEALAGHTSDLSPAKLHILTEAQVSYQAAAATLPLPSSIASLPSSCPSDHESAFTNTSSASEESAILDYYQFPTNPLLKQTPSPPSSPSSSSTIRRSKNPPPLTISSPRKSIFFTNALTGTLLTLDSFPAPPATPPFTPPPRSTSLQNATPHTNNDPYALSRAYERYNEHLYSFAEMLARHIQTISGLIRETREAQKRGRKGEEMGDLKARIRRLREGGWRRERFCPGRYQDLCDVALGDL